jgi:choline dehydrogenase-like flavoprotein
MIINSESVRSPPSSQKFHVCIAGGGVAGITLAKKLGEQGLRVAVLEGGGMEYSEASQEIYSGRSIGRSYFELDKARLRYLGGTSNHWEGWCRPLEEYDFEQHEYIEDSGWPIQKSDLDPYLAPARDILEIKPFPDDIQVEGSDGSLKEIFFRYSPPVQFKDKYLDLLKNTTNIHVYINANLTDIRINPDTGRVSGFLFQSFEANAPQINFQADYYILALGGIENARALLNSNKHVPAGIGNTKDLAGRFFMEHPHVRIGFYAVKSSHTRFGSTSRFLSPTKRLLTNAQIANSGVRLLIIKEKDVNFIEYAKINMKRILCSNDIIEDFVQTIRSFDCPPPFDKAGFLYIASEQVPNFNSRIALDHETDRFGLRRAVLDWRLTELDKRTIRETALAIGTFFARTDVGRIKLEDWLLEEGAAVPDVAKDPWLGAGRHHMGTTRMAATSRQGVVDSNCLVFETGNLFIAGSSVFPTAGHANPTLTIVQLSLRLADHLISLTKT